MRAKHNHHAGRGRPGGGGAQVSALAYFWFGWPPVPAPRMHLLPPQLLLLGLGVCVCDSISRSVAAAAHLSLCLGPCAKPSIPPHTCCPLPFAPQGPAAAAVEVCNGAAALGAACQPAGDRVDSAHDLSFFPDPFPKSKSMAARFHAPDHLHAICCTSFPSTNIGQPSTCSKHTCARPWPPELLATSALLRLVTTDLLG